MELVQLANLISPERVAFLRARDKASALNELASLLSQSVPDVDEAELMGVLNAREKIMSTGIGLGIAVPHARLRAAQKPVIAVGISREGIEYDSLDDKPVHIMVLIVVHLGAQKEYLRILARVTLLLKNDKLRDEILNAQSTEEVYKIFTGY